MPQRLGLFMGPPKERAVGVSEGLALEQPPLTIPWGIRPNELRRLFQDVGAEAALRFVTDGYYVARCVTLGGLGTQLGFHFRPRSETGKLAECELFDNGHSDLLQSFTVYQQHLEKVFGSARGVPGSYSREFPTYEWRKRGARVSHWVMDRFGPEEHVRIVKHRLWGLWPT